MRDREFGGVPDGVGPDFGDVIGALRAPSTNPLPTHFVMDLYFSRIPFFSRLFA